ncbi:hypothetical protein DPMN_096287 [Dreissena polymorpha]|uniref:Uncharacterized protein n=2 Tax=Dreissena polymorpha TaxID=45954 RepID=A0A9D4R5A8_DREPO|nr:hypothetical protein DPMN_096287 [Dreissena polymorpha]
MNLLFVLTLTLSSATYVSGYCFVSASDTAHGGKCALQNGTLIDVGTEVTYADKCERCICIVSHQSGSVLSCCGYGIHAGVFAPIPGCKITTEEDGCTMRLVREDDETKDC